MLKVIMRMASYRKTYKSIKLMLGFVTYLALCDRYMCFDV